MMIDGRMPVEIIVDWHLTEGGSVVVDGLRKSHGVIEGNQTFSFSGTALCR